MVNVKVNATLLDRTGNPIKELDVEVTVGLICCRVLDAIFPSDKDENFSTKMQKWNLMEKITSAEKTISTVDLDAKEISMLQDRLAFAQFPPSIVGRMSQALEGR